MAVWVASVFRGAIQTTAFQFGMHRPVEMTRCVLSAILVLDHFLYRTEKTCSLTSIPYFSFTWFFTASHQPSKFFSVSFPFLDSVNTSSQPPTQPHPAMPRHA
jgi:hypothetical protein